MSYRWLIAVLLLATCTLAGWLNNRAMEENYIEDQLSSKTVEVQAQSQMLANEIAKSGYLTGQMQASLDTEIAQLSNLYEGRVLIINRNFKIIRDTYKLDEGKINISEEIIRCFSGASSLTSLEDGYYIEYILPITSSTSGEVIGCLVVDASVESIYKTNQRMVEKNNTRGWLMFFLMIPISVVVSGYLAKPFHTITKELNKAADGSLEDVIMVDSFRETKDVSDAYNRTLDRLRRLDESRQQFVSNVSHELKTPITSIRVLADSLLAQPDAPAELYREFLGDISEEIDRENRIIEDLLSLVKLDKSNQELNITSVNLNIYMEGLLKRLRPLALKKQVELVLESYRPVTAEVDEMKLSLALSNIIENAIKYNIEGGWVRVTLNADHKYFYVKVADSGIGIPAGAQEHIFERFYRADKSRSRETGGTGLGLAITQSIVYLHHGAIKLHSEEGVGTTFTIRVPLIYIP